jgi:hypothetical protein
LVKLLQKLAGCRGGALTKIAVPFSSRAWAGVALCAGVFLVLFLRLQPSKKNEEISF